MKPRCYIIYAVRRYSFSFARPQPNNHFMYHSTTRQQTAIPVSYAGGTVLVCKPIARICTDTLANDYQFAQQCQARSGYGYFCSLVSKWSNIGGGPHGRITKNSTVFSSFKCLKGFGDHVHSKGLKPESHLLPGLAASDLDATIENMTIKFGDVQCVVRAHYSFQWRKDGVQQ